MRQKKSKIDSAVADAKALVRQNPQQASKLADWGFKQSQAIQYLKGQGDAQAVFSSLYVESNPAASYDFALKAKEIYQQIGDKVSEAEVMLTIASFYERSGWTCRSHYVLLRALEIATQAEHARLVATTLFNLGANAEGREDLASALDYFMCAKLSAEEANLKHIYLRAVCAEQEMHYRLKDGHFQIQVINDSLEALAGAGMERTLIEVELFLSKVSRDSHDYKSARAYLRRAYTMAQSVNDAQLKAEIICQLGENRLEDSRLSSAQKLLKLSLGLARELGLRSVELTSLKHLARATAQLGGADVALDLMMQYSGIKDDLHAHESKLHFQEMRSSHDLHLLAEESKALKQTNLELAAVNERLEATLREKKTLQAELERLATIDELTGSLNRREIMAFGAELVSRFHTQGRPAVVMIVDIDHFKSINDGFGHTAGDEVLRRFAKSCQKVLRPTDRFGRLGGEEFCILLDRTNLEIALKVAERVMISIRASRVADILGDRIVTASIGVVEVGRKHKTIEEALHDADLAMYEAKRTGRDKICVTSVKKKKAA